MVADAIALTKEMRHRWVGNAKQRSRRAFMLEHNGSHQYKFGVLRSRGYRYARVRSMSWAAAERVEAASPEIPMKSMYAEEVG